MCVCVRVLLLGLKGVDDKLVKIDRRIFCVVVIIYSQGTAGTTSHLLTHQTRTTFKNFFGPPTLRFPPLLLPPPLFSFFQFFSPLSLSLSPPLPSSNSLLAALPGVESISGKGPPLPPLLGRSLHKNHNQNQKTTPKFAIHHTLFTKNTISLPHRSLKSKNHI